jgi:hypothetical protein
MKDEVKHGRPPFDDVDARILACLSHEPFSSIRSIAQGLGLAPATVHRHLTTSLDMQPRHFRWAPHVLTRELGDQRVPGARLLLDVLRQQEQTHYRDIITGDESWLFVVTAPSSIWLLWDEESATRHRRTINADKRMLIAFWWIKGLVDVNWPPKNVRINVVYFRDETLMPISQKFQANISGRHRPWTLMHRDNAKVHTAKMVSGVMPDLRLKRTPQQWMTIDKELPQ